MKHNKVTSYYNNKNYFNKLLNIEEKQEESERNSLIKQDDIKINTKHQSVSITKNHKKHNTSKYVKYKDDHNTVHFKEKNTKDSLFKTPVNRLKSVTDLSKISKKNKLRGPLTNQLFEFALKLHNKEYKEYKDTMELEDFHLKLMVNAILQSLLSFLSIILCIFHLSALSNQANTNKFNQQEAKYSVTVAIFGSTVLLFILIIFEYFLISNVMKITTTVPSWIWRKKIKNVLKLIMNLLVILVHPNPIFTQVTFKYYVNSYHNYIYYEINNIFSIFVMLRIFFLVKAVLFLSKFSNPRIHRLSKMNGISLDFLFPFKCLMIDNPIFLYTILFLMFLLFGTFSIIVAEAPLETLTKVNFSNWWNAIWGLIITILTIGYGDFVPKSILGRIIIIITCFGGTFLISMLIATFSSIFSFDIGEKTVCLLIERLSLNEEKETGCVRVISKYIELMKFFKKNKHCLIGKKNMIKELKERKKEIVEMNSDLKTTLDKIKESYTKDAKDEFIIDYINLMENDLEILLKKFEQLSIRFEKLEIRDASEDSNIKTNLFTKEKPKAKSVVFDFNDSSHFSEGKEETIEHNTFISHIDDEIIN